MKEQKNHRDGSNKTKGRFFCLDKNEGVRRWDKRTVPLSSVLSLCPTTPNTPTHEKSSPPLRHVSRDRADENFLVHRG